MHVCRAPSSSHSRARRPTDRTDDTTDVVAVARARVRTARRRASAATTHRSRVDRVPSSKRRRRLDLVLSRRRDDATTATTRGRRVGIVVVLGGVRHGGVESPRGRRHRRGGGGELSVVALSAQYAQDAGAGARAGRADDSRRSSNVVSRIGSGSRRDGARDGAVHGDVRDGEDALWAVAERGGGGGRVGGVRRVGADGGHLEADAGGEGVVDDGGAVEREEEGSFRRVWEFFSARASV